MVDDERLVDLVKANDLLYNRSNPNYKTYETKKKVWADIASELGVPEEVANKRYRNLRDRFVREKRVELLNGTENTYRAPIVERMQFLTPHIFTRNAITTDKVACSAKTTDPLQPSSSTSDSAMHIPPKSPEQYEYEDSMLELQYSPEPPPAVSFKRRAVETTRLDNDVAATTIEVDNAFCNALRSFEKLCQTREERNGNEVLHGFGQMIVGTIAGMSTEKQARAMLRVTEIVMQIKMEPDG